MSTKTLAKSPVGGEQVATGTYTGNGAATQAIVGVGFQPRFIMIYPQYSGINGSWGWKNDQHGLPTTFYWQGGIRFLWMNDMIISLDADGFTVGDGTGVANYFNRNEEEYTYICFS